MYLLSYEDSLEFKSKFQSAIRNPSEDWRWIAEGSLRERFHSRLKELDRGYFGDDIPSGVKMMLAELHGEGSKLNYGSSMLGSDLRLPEQQMVGRAMVLSDRSFGLLDGLSARLIGEIIEGFEDSTAYELRMGDSEEPFSWLSLRRALRAYFLPGMGVVSESGVTRHDLELELRSSRSRVLFGFTVSRSGRGIEWYCRGISLLKPSHMELISRLNTVMDDYSRRLSWMERYQSAELRLNGYTEDQISSVKSKFNVFFSMSDSMGGSRGSIRSDFEELRPGVTFGDDPIIATDGIYASRIYFARCEECRRVAAVEIPTNISSSMRVPKWRSPRMYRSTVIEGSVGSILKNFHEESGCDGTSALSTRTGRVFNPDTIGY